MNANDIYDAMEKALLNIEWYYNHDYSDVIKLRETEYRLGIVYGYGKVLEAIENDLFWQFHERYMNKIKEYESFCRKTTTKYAKMD